MVPTAVSEPGGLGIRTDQYLHASLRIPRADPTSGEVSDLAEFGARVAVTHEELVRRLAAEPDLGPIAIASTPPGMSHARRYVQIEGVPLAPGLPAPAHAVSVARVDVGYFEALDQPILNGRDFNTSDLGDNRSAVIVNRSFVDRVLGGRNPLGRRVRYWTVRQEQPRPWSLEIVGVVERLGMMVLSPDRDEG